MNHDPRAWLQAAALVCLALLSAAAAAPEPAEIASLAVIDTALREGRLEDAAAVAARLSATQDSPELRLRAAEVALASAAWTEAAVGFAALVDTPAIAARAQQGLGLALYHSGERDGATRALEAAVATDPTLVRAWVAIAALKDRDRDFAAADAAYARALALDPACAAALSNRGYSLLLRGRADDAEADLLRATQIEPGLAVAQTNLRVARAMQGRYKEAFAGSSKESLAADLNNVGFGAMARGDTRTAETYFNRALSLNPHFDRVAWDNLKYLKAISQPMTSLTRDELPQ